MEEKCNPATTNGCAFIVGVAGTGDDNWPLVDDANPTDILSSFRIKGFYGHNKLKIETPVINSPVYDEINGSFYDYFWFVINDTTWYHDADFDY
jgi:hypothetical protein